MPDISSTHARRSQRQPLRFSAHAPKGAIACDAQAFLDLDGLIGGLSGMTVKHVLTKAP